MTLVPIIYIPISKTYKTNKGLSERLIKKHYEKLGYQVWRGGYIHAINNDTYPVVLKKYARLLSLLHRYKRRHVQTLMYYSHIQKGMPDFIIFKDKRFIFIECKFRQEQLSLKQKRCITKLQKIGFQTQIVKIVTRETKLRKAIINIYTNQKIKVEKQLKLKLNWK